MRLCRPMVRPKPLALTRCTVSASSPAFQVVTWSSGPNHSCVDDPRSRRAGSGSAARTGPSAGTVDRLDPAVLHRLAMRPSAGRRRRWSITGPTSVRGSAGSPTISVSIAPAQHLQRALGDLLLQHQQAQRRAALAGRAEGRGDDVLHHLLGQSGGIDDHRVDPAGLGDQRDDRPVVVGEQGRGRSSWRSRSSR